MYFEVYVDSLILLQFVMNCYLLALVNSMLRQTVSLRRILCGALCGAVLSFFPFLLPLKVFLSVALSFLMSVLCMTVVTFRTYRRESFFRVLEKLSISTVLLGGVLMILLRILPKEADVCLGITGVLLAGGAVYGILLKILKKSSKEKNTCQVTLFGSDRGTCGEEAAVRKVSIEALIDTGNSLVEPMSGKPVAVLDKAVFEQVFEEEPLRGFRMIPFHSIGKKSGVLPGYLLERILVETEESTKEYRDIYVGISEEIISEANTYKMILNPRMLL